MEARGPRLICCSMRSARLCRLAVGGHVDHRLQLQVIAESSGHRPLLAAATEHLPQEPAHARSLVDAAHAPAPSIHCARTGRPADPRGSCRGSSRRCSRDSRSRGSPCSAPPSCSAAASAASMLPRTGRLRRPSVARRVPLRRGGIRAAPIDPDRWRAGPSPDCGSGTAAHAPSGRSHRRSVGGRSGGSFASMPAAGRASCPSPGRSRSGTWDRNARSRTSTCRLPSRSGSRRCPRSTPRPHRSARSSTARGCAIARGLSVGRNGHDRSAAGCGR